jgi:hypothetical protein
MRPVKLAFPSAIFGILLAPPAASAAEISSHLTDEGNAVIEISGEIVTGDARRFKAEAAKYDGAVVVLESEGGKTLEAIEIGEALRLKGFSTLVFNGDQCVSSCGLIWLAGTPRGLSRSARVGFHAAYVDEGGRSVESGVGNAIVGRYFTLLNLPLTAIVFATAASPDTVNWLTAGNSDELGVSAQVVDDIDYGNSSPIMASAQADGEAEIIATKDFSWSNGAWTVLSDTRRTGCFALLEFDSEGGVSNNSALEISKDRHRPYAVFSLRNDKFRSIVDGRDYQLAITFRTGTRIDSGWGEKSFSGIEYDSGQHGLVTSLEWEPLRADIRAEDSVTFTLGAKVVDSYPLKGSAEAIDQLDKCLRVNLPAGLPDPFG